MGNMDAGPKINPGNNGNGIDPKEAIKAMKMFLEDVAREEGKEEEVEDSPKLPNLKERLRKIDEELSKLPFRVVIDSAKLKELLSSGQVTFPYVDLHNRKLTEGEKIILIGEDLKEYEAVFDSITQKSRRGAKMTVRLPETQNDIIKE